MPLRGLIVLPGLVLLAVTTISPAAALGATKGTDRRRYCHAHCHGSGHVHLYGNGYSRGGERR
jgi:hypothetical protein